MNYKFGRFVLKQYRLRGKIAVITRAYSDLFIKEAEKDELHLANLAVKPRNRGKGIGSQALTYFEQKARQAGFSKVSLAVDINNQKARQLYERLGYQVKAMNVAPKKRAQHSISGSLRMVKDLDHEG